MAESINVFDIDALAENFKAVQVKLRGQLYELGGTAYSILMAASLVDVDEEEGNEKAQAAKFMKQLRPMLAYLSPELERDTRDNPLSAAEELALLPAVTEVMNRVGALSFRSEEEAQQ